MTKPAKITPMLKQYLEIKSRYQDAILFYRLGDFYEMFFDDAVTASRVLGITLTSRSNKDDKNRIPLCGIPFHAAPSYLSKLVAAGFKVAICEQMEDAKQAKGVVKREVVRVITPGLATFEQLLNDKDNRYLAAICRQKKRLGLSLLDISTGEFLVTECDSVNSLLDELNRLSPAEILLQENDNHETDKELRQALSPIIAENCLTERSASTFLPEVAREALLQHFQVVNLAGFGCEEMTVGVAAAGALLCYLIETQKTSLTHIEHLTPLDLSNVLMMDDSSRRNLELTQTIIGAKRQGSLLATLDQTSTPMGARLLKRNLLLPLQDVSTIKQRLDTVEYLYENLKMKEELRDILTHVYDLERLNSRVVLGSANGRDLIGIKKSLKQLPRLKTTLATTTGLLHDIYTSFDELADIYTLLDNSIHEEPPLALRDGNLIKFGFDLELDELLIILKDGKRMILALEAEERHRTGISNLKVGFNKVFGYYLEVSRGRLGNVPDNYIRKQTLVNAERFITPELKEFESKVSSAEEKRLDLEYQLFIEIRLRLATASSRILKAAAVVGWIDFFCCLAEVAQRYRYIRPEVNDGEIISIQEGRHPVIEQSLPTGSFVPNDIHLDQVSSEVLIVTGPNMAGKSTILRQTGLITLMAQMGCFVPAAAAVIGVVDRIFTRVGAMDDLRRGQSTFMVEMNETANILNNATEKSLVILDEIGRGTSTFDGLSIAWAVAEDLVNKNGKGVKTVFATHYHELTELATVHARIKNYHIAVREWNDTIIFLHKFMVGGTNRSYGIQVAALAGVPPRVVARAKEILHNIEKGEFTRQGQPRIAGLTDKTSSTEPNQLYLFAGNDDPVAEKLAAVQPDTLSPLEALSFLYELKDTLKNCNR